jgi:hypothetical protein
MAANDDLPRGWQYGSGGAVAAPSITVPATPGVSHVLDAVSATMLAGAAVGPFNVTVTSSGGTYNGEAVGVLYTSDAGTDGASPSGLNMACMAGESLTVACASGGTDVYLQIQGHDN